MQCGFSVYIMFVVLPTDICFYWPNGHFILAAPLQASECFLLLGTV